MDIVVIADDLTGANADGALLTAKGFHSATCLGLDIWDSNVFQDYTAVSISTDSRLLNKGEAYKAVYTAVRTMASSDVSLVAKRIDSTLRGNIGAEIEAALQALDDIQLQDAKPGSFSPPVTAIVVPAYPSSGRLTVGGYLIVHGIPLERSPIANDSATPIQDTSVAKIIRKQTTLPIGAISLETILAGTHHVRNALCSLHQEGRRVIICDAVTNEDIKILALALADIPFPILAVDPGPFTAELASVRVECPRDQFENRVFFCIGSTTELTRSQIEYLQVTHPCHICPVSVLDLLADEGARNAEIDKIISLLQQAPDEAEVLGICTAAHPEDVFSLEEMAAKTNLTPSQISSAITDSLSAITKRALALPNLRIGGLYTSGGEVTVNAIRSLNAKGFSVRDEVLPLAVYGRLIQGEFPDLPMVTKGGFVGDKESLTRCIEYLFTKISTKRRKE